MSPTPEAEQFPWYLFALFPFLHLSICYPTSNSFIKQWIIAPAMVAISVHLASKHASITHMLGYNIGAYLSSHLFSMIHIVYAQKGFPDCWRRVKDEMAATDKENKLPSLFPFRRKLAWALDLSLADRHVGWIQEPKALPPHPSCSRMAFIRSRMLNLLITTLTLDLIYTFYTGHPAFDCRVHPDTDGPEAYLRGQPLLWRIPLLTLWGIRTVCVVSRLFTTLSLVSVILRHSEPAEWPNVYGSFLDAYSLRQFWGKVWHQLLRPTFSGLGKFVAHDVFRFKSGTNLSSYTQLFVAFIVSGCMHASSDYMMIGHFTPYSLQFFFLQAAAISVEDFAIWITKANWPKMDKRVNRMIGYLWVISWFIWSGPLWVDSLSAGGYHTDERGVIFRKAYEIWNTQR